LNDFSAERTGNYIANTLEIRHELPPGEISL